MYFYVYVSCNACCDLVGYYMATLEAATEHIVQMGEDYAAVLTQSKLVGKLVEKSTSHLPTKTSGADIKL